MTLADIQLLYEYNYWAKSRLLQSLDSLREEDLSKDLKSSFPSIHATLTHIIGAEQIWLQRFTGEPPQKFLAVQDVPTYAAAKEKWGHVEHDMISYVQSLTEDRLRDVFAFKNLKGEPVSQVRWQALQHLVNHGTYHRGQLTTMIRQIGGTPPNADLIAFYRQKK